MLYEWINNYIHFYFHIKTERFLKQNRQHDTRVNYHYYYCYAPPRLSRYLNICLVTRASNQISSHRSLSGFVYLMQLNLQLNANYNDDRSYACSAESYHVSCFNYFVRTPALERLSGEYLHRSRIIIQLDRNTYRYRIVFQQIFDNICEISLLKNHQSVSLKT